MIDFDSRAKWHLHHLLGQIVIRKWIGMGSLAVVFLVGHRSSFVEVTLLLLSRGPWHGCGSSLNIGAVHMRRFIQSEVKVNVHDS